MVTACVLVAARTIQASWMLRQLAAKRPARLLQSLLDCRNDCVQFDDEFCRCSDDGMALQTTNLVAITPSMLHSAVSHHHVLVKTTAIRLAHNGARDDIECSNTAIPVQGT